MGLHWPHRPGELRVSIRRGVADSLWTLLKCVVGWTGELLGSLAVWVDTKATVPKRQRTTSYSG